MREVRGAGPYRILRESEIFEAARDWSDEYLQWNPAYKQIRIFLEELPAQISAKIIEGGTLSALEDEDIELL